MVIGGFYHAGFSIDNRTRSWPMASRNFLPGTRLGRRNRKQYGTWFRRALPTPVHVFSAVETRNRVRRTRFGRAAHTKYYSGDVCSNTYFWFSGWTIGSSSGFFLLSHILRTVISVVYVALTCTHMTWRLTLKCWRNIYFRQFPHPSHNNSIRFRAFSYSRRFRYRWRRKTTDEPRT